MFRRDARLDRRSLSVRHISARPSTCASCEPSKLYSGSLHTPNMTQGDFPTAATTLPHSWLVAAVGHPSEVRPLRRQQQQGGSGGSPAG